MSEEEKTSAASSFPAPLGFVKGGTTTLAWDNEMARRSADAEARRAKQDEETRIARTEAGAAQHTMKVGGTSNYPVIVLALKDKSGNIYDYAVCELNFHGGARVGADAQIDPNALPEEVARTVVSDDRDWTLHFICPRCVLTRERHSQWSQLTLRASQKRMRLRVGIMPKWMQSPHANLWINPADPREFYQVAGTIDIDEWCTCDHEGCGYRFKIDDSVVVS